MSSQTPFRHFDPICGPTPFDPISTFFSGKVALMYFIFLCLKSINLGQTQLFHIDGNGQDQSAVQDLCKVNKKNQVTAARLFSAMSCMMPAIE